MPTFDFRCLKCETVFEFSRPFGSKDSPSCPSCKSKKTEKLFAAPTVVFKGEGWYKTDSRKGTKGTKDAKEPKTEDTSPKDATTQPPRSDSGQAPGSVPAATGKNDSAAAAKKSKK